MPTRVMVINDPDEILVLLQKTLATTDCQVFLQFFLNSNVREVQENKRELIVLDYYVSQEGVGWDFLQLLKSGQNLDAI